jgi:YjbE family integral membrane protein
VEALWGDLLQPAFWVAVGQIIGVNVILSGDNAVVIALACMQLPPRQRMWGMILGAGVAVLLRVVFTLGVAQLMTYPYLKLVGGVLLLWVAVKLVAATADGDDGSVEAADNLWRAVRIVAIADIVMSLDNVIAIAASAETAAARVDVLHAVMIKTTLIVFGLTTSIPLIVAGSAALMALLERFPILIWAGGGLLGWVAGDIMIRDEALLQWFPAPVIHTLHYWSAALGAVFVIGFGYVRKRMRRATEKEI